MTEREQRMYRLAAEQGIGISRVDSDPDGRVYVVAIPFQVNLPEAEILVGLDEDPAEYANSRRKSRRDLRLVSGDEAQDQRRGRAAPPAGRGVPGAGL